MLATFYKSRFLDQYLLQTNCADDITFNQPPGIRPLDILPHDLTKQSSKGQTHHQTVRSAPKASEIPKKLKSFNIQKGAMNSYRLPEVGAEITSHPRLHGQRLDGTGREDRKRRGERRTDGEAEEDEEYTSRETAKGSDLRDENGRDPREFCRGDGLVAAETITRTRILYKLYPSPFSSHI